MFGLCSCNAGLPPYGERLSPPDPRQPRLFRLCPSSTGTAAALMLPASPSSSGGSGAPGGPAGGEVVVVAAAGWGYSNTQ